MRRVLEGAISVLMKTGMPREWWSEAARCYCFLRNANDKVELEKKPPYEMRHGAMFNGRRIPFGASLSYKPAAKWEFVATKELDSSMRSSIHDDFE